MEHLLIVMLLNGTIDRIVRVDSYEECYARSQFEMRYDPRVPFTFCVRSTGGEV